MLLPLSSPQRSYRTCRSMRNLTFVNSHQIFPQGALSVDSRLFCMKMFRIVDLSHHDSKVQSSHVMATHGGLHFWGDESVLHCQSEIWAAIQEMQRMLSDLLLVVTNQVKRGDRAVGQWANAIKKCDRKWAGVGRQVSTVVFLKEESQTEDAECCQPCCQSSGASFECAVCFCHNSVQFGRTRNFCGPAPRQLRAIQVEIATT